MSAGEWGIRSDRKAAGRKTHLVRILKTTTRRGAATILLLATLTLLTAGPALAAATDARADFLGIGSAVEDWICGLVDPEEPWEAVGDGPEGWIGNKNLAGALPVTAPAITFNGTDLVVDTDHAGIVIGSAPGTMDRLTAVPAGSYTLYEVAGLRGVSWWTIPLDPSGAGRNCSIWAYMWTWAANGIFTLNKVLLQVTIAIKEAASDSSPLAFLYDDTQGVVGTLFTVFFVPVACLMLTITAMYAGIRSIRSGNARYLLSSLLIFCSVGLGAALMYGLTTTDGNGFRSVLRITDEAIAGINDMSAQILLGELADGQGNCALPEGQDVTGRGQRITSCILADTLVYRPWAIGQFGGAGAAPMPIPDTVKIVQITPDAKVGDQLPPESTTLPCYVDFNGCTELRSYLIAQHGGISVGGRFGGQEGYVWCVATVTSAVSLNISFADFKIPNRAACRPMWQVFSLLAATDLSAAKAYSGNVGMARVSQAVVAIIGTLIAGLAVLTTALLAMLWHGKTFALWLIGPFKLAIAVSKGTVKMAKEWAMDLVWAQTCRVAYGVVLTIVILVISYLLQSHLPFGLRLVWLGVVLFSFWKLIGKVQGLLKPGAASEATAGDIDTVKLAAAKATGMAGGVVHGAANRSVATGQGAHAALERRRIVTAEPDRGLTRRLISPLATAAAVTGAATKGAVTGSAAATQQRTDRARSKVIAGRLGADTKPSNAPAAPTPTSAGPAPTRSHIPAHGGDRTDTPGSRPEQAAAAERPGPTMPDRAEPSPRPETNHPPADPGAPDSQRPPHPTDPARSEQPPLNGSGPDASRPAHNPTPDHQHRPELPHPGLDRAGAAAAAPDQSAPQPTPGKAPADPAAPPQVGQKVPMSLPEAGTDGRSGRRRKDQVVPVDASAIPRWRASFDLPDLPIIPDVPERISHEPAATDPAPALY